MKHQQPFLRFVIIGILVIGVIFFFHPSSWMPKQFGNICVIFHQKSRWYWAAKAVRKKWGIPISTQMAIIMKESHFYAAAKPAHQKLWGLIPWFRPTSAEGYAQAVDSTWQLYLRETHQRSADRRDFAKATDFVGWYLHRIHRRLKIPTEDVFHLYLAYHEGSGGYVRRSYANQPHLIAIARHVAQLAEMYRKQLLMCEKKLPKKHWYSVF